MLYEVYVNKTIRKKKRDKEQLNHIKEKGYGWEDNFPGYLAMGLELNNKPSGQEKIIYNSGKNYVPYSGTECR